MKAIKVIFPKASNVLCVWHIQKNILANCKSYFRQTKDWDAFLTDWNSLVYSSTEEAFEKACHEIQLSYKEKTDVLSYIQKTWLPYKEYFVDAWTKKLLHFGNRATSRAEGAHSKLKKIDTRAYLFPENGVSNSEYPLEVILTDLQERYQQWPLVEKEYAQEKLSQLLNRSSSLNFEPTIQHEKGRPSTGRKRKTLNSTTRDPSQFENVEASLRRKTQQDAAEDGGDGGGGNVNNADMIDEDEEEDEILGLIRAWEGKRIKWDF
ncbi:hypothetical protein ACH5RR_031489 [Cinchona calisaya]|uniref:Protein FAR1-RELATED SEQUENCE n=1 Tax=Cinchona calisaya TaxID=153742 RepID=A0ABD2YIF4_9GENT